jgi:ring-1,2-phenylacetyl-CoA epoxidase subunit PaaE
MDTIVSDVLKEHNVLENVNLNYLRVQLTKNKIEESLEGHTKKSRFCWMTRKPLLKCRKATVLEAALKQGLDARIRVKVEFVVLVLQNYSRNCRNEENGLTDGEIAKGLILTCQAHPTSAEQWIMRTRIVVGCEF